MDRLIQPLDSGNRPWDTLGEYVSLPPGWESWFRWRISW